MIIWPWGQRSRSHEGHYGTRHTALWSCTHIPNIIDLSRKKQLFDLEVNGQGPTKVIMIRDTPPYGHASTCKISLTYLDRQKSYGPDKLRWEEAEEAEEKIRLKQYMSPFVRRGDIIKSIFKDYVDGRLCMHGGLLLVLPGKWVHRRLLVGFLFLDL